MFKKHLPLIKTFVGDRSVLALWIVFALAAIVVVITAAVHVVPSELQVTVHYTAFGVTNFYRDNWYYLIVFVLQALLFFIAHTLIAVKLYDQKGRGFAILFLALSLATAIITELLLAGLFRVVSLVQ